MNLCIIYIEKIYLCIYLLFFIVSPNPSAGSLTFNLLAQSRYANLPEFTLNFEVVNAPPTYIECYVDEHPVDVATLSREVLVANYMPVPKTSITVMLKTRQAGNYHCNVSVFRASVSKLNDTKTPLLSITGQLTTA